MKITYFMNYIKITLKTINLKILKILKTTLKYF